MVAGTYVHRSVYACIQDIRAMSLSLVKIRSGTRLAEMKDPTGKDFGGSKHLNLSREIL